MDLDRSVLASIEETLRRAFDHVSATASKAPKNAPTWENRNAQPYACVWKTKVRMLFAASSTTQALRRAPYRHDSVETRPSRPSAGRVFRRGDRRVHPSAAILLAERRQRRKRFAELNEIGCMLQRIGGRGTMRNTERGTLEIVLRFPCRSPCSKPPCCAPEASASQFPHSGSCASSVRPRPRPARRRSGRRVESNLNLVRGRTRRAYRDAQPRCQALSA